MSELNPTRASLLGFLHDGPSTGWDLLDTVQRTIGYFWNVTPSHVYRELNALEAVGFISGGEPGTRSRRLFTLTDSGREAFADWIDREPSHELIRFPLLITMFFGHHVGRARLATFLRNHREHHRERLAEYRRIEGLAAQGDQFVLATVQFGIAYEQAALDWFDAQLSLGTDDQQPRPGRRETLCRVLERRPPA